jgi:hypothetical protein
MTKMDNMMKKKDIPYPFTTKGPTSKENGRIYPRSVAMRRREMVNRGRGDKILRHLDLASDEIEPQVEYDGTVTRTVDGQRMKARRTDGPGTYRKMDIF